MYRLLDKNIEELDKEELTQLLFELNKQKEDNPIVNKLVSVLKEYDEGQVKKHELGQLNHTIRTLLAVLRKNKEEEYRTVGKVEQEEKLREHELDDAIQCPRCNHFSPKNHRFCTSCGGELYNRMDKVCARCNGLNNHNATYCMHCGAQFHKGQEAKLPDGEVECPFCGKQAKGGKTETSVGVTCPHCGAEWGGSKEQYEQLVRNL